MKLAIRDDDTCYFTKPEQLEMVYGKIWDKIPVSLSVVPFHACTKSGSVPKQYWSGNKIFPIGENEELVRFLKKKIREGKVSIMLHGYSHKDDENGYEFVAGDTLHSKVREGKEYLEELFEVEIKTFVPPHNSLSKEGAKAVIDNGLNILGSSPTPFNRPFDIKVFTYLLKRIHFVRTNGKDDVGVVYPFVMTFESHCEFLCNSLIPSTMLEDLIYNLELAQGYNGDFCLNTHYWEFFESENMRKDLNDFLRYANGTTIKIKFIEANKLFV
jgi:hypothetical protein